MGSGSGSASAARTENRAAERGLSGTLVIMRRALVRGGSSGACANGSNADDPRNDAVGVGAGARDRLRFVPLGRVVPFGPNAMPTTNPRAPAVTLKLYTPVTDEDIQDIIADRERINIVTQPVVDLRRGVIVGYEALARFTLGSGRSSFPEEVFVAAEEFGLGIEVEAAVVRRALEISRDRPKNCFVSINVDPVHLGCAEVLDAIGRHGDLAGVIFEITEHNDFRDTESVRLSAEVLRRHGAMIAIDDAGAGYSGLKRIVELQPQFIKIDRELVTGIHMNEAKRTLVQMLGELAGRLDAWIVAEGIETEPELNAIAQLGVPLGQGYALARPAPGWGSLDEEAVISLRSIVGRHSSALAEKPLLLADLIEPPGICHADEEWPINTPLAIRVDRAGRPLEMRLLGDEQGTRLRMEYDLLRAKSSTPVAEVALRITTRSERLRWDPIVCIDEQGNLEGVVPVQRILSGLANHCLTLDAPPRKSPDRHPRR